MKGYAGRFLRVNLSAGTVANEPLPMQVAMDFIAGRGFGIKYLYDELAPNVDPLGEHNKLLLVPGVLAGTQAQAVSRWVACTKSPLTGCYARSCGGGDFGAWMKFAGYDFVLIEGKAEKPVYLYIAADGAHLRMRVNFGEKTPQKPRTGLNSAMVNPPGPHVSVRLVRILSNMPPLSPVEERRAAAV